MSSVNGVHPRVHHSDLPQTVPRDIHNPFYDHSRPYLNVFHDRPRPSHTFYPYEPEQVQQQVPHQAPQEVSQQIPLHFPHHSSRHDVSAYSHQIPQSFLPPYRHRGAHYDQNQQLPPGLAPPSNHYNHPPPQQSQHSYPHHSQQSAIGSQSHHPARAEFSLFDHAPPAETYSGSRDPRSAAENRSQTTASDSVDAPAVSGTVLREVFRGPHYSQGAPQQRFDGQYPVAVNPGSSVDVEPVTPGSDDLYEGLGTGGSNMQTGAVASERSTVSERSIISARSESGPCVPPDAQPVRSDSPYQLARFTTVEEIPEDSLADTMAFLLEKLCKSYPTRYPDFPHPHDPAALFFSPVRQKAFTLNFYCKRLLEYTYCSKSCAVVAIIYIIRLSNRFPVFRLNDFNVHRLICTAVVLAAKFMDDLSFSNAHYAKVAGIQNADEMNKLEAYILKALDYRLFVNVGDYKKVETQFVSIARGFVS